MVGLCLLTPPGRVLLWCTAAIPVGFTLLHLSYFAGRNAARIHNRFARHAARAELERYARAQSPASLQS